MATLRDTPPEASTSRQGSVAASRRSSISFSGSAAESSAMGALRGPSLQLQGAASVQEGLSGNDAALTGEEIPIPEDEASPSQDTGDIDDGPWHKKLPWDVRRKVWARGLYSFQLLQ
ncbi:hypothetical protein DFQ26_005248 [Actinomortierella ambigua]|nr:hypothetical protein DFQ26_005248 [Actinomortierella ambigua]